VRAFLVGDMRMLVGRAIERDPQQHDNERERRADKKRIAPPKGKRHPNNQRRRYHSANARARIKDGHGESALALWEPLRDGLGRARPIARFTKAEHKAE
jgi:hypothetical protein